MAFVSGGVLEVVGVRGGTRSVSRASGRFSGKHGLKRAVVVRASLEMETVAPTDEPTAFIAVTDTATKQLTMLRDSNGKDCLRVGVRQGGCSGLSYYMEFDTSDNIEKFDEVTEVSGMKIVCDVKSLMYMFGMTLDFSTDLVGGGFKFFNPKATSTCGCGQSFGV
ncbi:hypothetical protein NDN08_003229 [Rhodosorus marinus]|uniref:Core domain-containing protein n=1 Tax=Rhodosorus marinus TaxID=101924 RepID=A0AAV8UVX2_9RHOD|nr:hypothetical protein NDN08_003229 [Rhodosorus marinus]